MQEEMKFDCPAWLSGNVSMLSPASRGIWFDLLCVMHIEGRVGRLKGTIEALARSGRCDQEQFWEFLEEAKATGVADIARCNGFVTITNRRMWRENKGRKMVRERVMRHRKGKQFEESGDCNGSVTGGIKVNGLSYEVKKNNIKKGLCLEIQKAGAALLIIIEKQLAPLTKREEGTFKRLVRSVMYHSQEHGPEVFEQVPQWLNEVMNFVHEHEKTIHDAKLIFVSSVKKRLGIKRFRND